MASTATNTTPRRPARHITVASPIGELTVVASSVGVLRLVLPTHKRLNPLPDPLIERISAALTDEEIKEATAQAQILGASQKQLNEYFAGKRTFFSLNYDLRPAISQNRSIVANPWVPKSGTFRLQTQLALQTIPYGQTISYGELASTLGRPKAGRAVGTACSTNPIPILLPCHRVLPASGKLGSYSGSITGLGPETKRWLLALEGVRV